MILKLAGFISVTSPCDFLFGYVSASVPFAGKLKTNAPSAKRQKLDTEGEEEEGEEEMEEGGGGLLEIPTQAQATSVPAKPPMTEAMEAEKKMAMARSGKTVEERQEEFKEMLLERGVRH